MEPRTCLETSRSRCLSISCSSTLPILTASYIQGRQWYRPRRNQKRGSEPSPNHARPHVRQTHGSQMPQTLLSHPTHHLPGSLRHWHNDSLPRHHKTWSRRLERVCQLASTQPLRARRGHETFDAGWPGDFSQAGEHGCADGGC
jgi:hypothetical protein